MSIDKTSINDGIGVRVVLYVSGCDIQCEGCHNPETHNLNAGKPFDIPAFRELIDALSKPYVRGLTLSGGHPLHPCNIEIVEGICAAVKDLFPEKDIWLYTGYTWEDIYKKRIDYILQYIDVLVDGPFVLNLRDTNIPFRGSMNQRIIDVKESLRKNKVVELKIPED